jgi:hypothetical protein
MENEDVLKLVKEVKKELGSYRKPFEKDWEDYDNAYYGKQHKTGENVKTVKNHVFKIIESEIPILTDSMPGTLVTSMRAETQPQAEVLEKSIKWVYQDQSLQLLLPSLMRSALMSAPGYIYAFYNPDAKGGDGGIEYKQIPWKHVWLDGNVQNIDQAEKMHIEIPMRREALMRAWPEFADQIKKIKGGQNITENSSDDNFERRDVSGRDTGMGKPKAYKGKDILNYCETWVKDYSLKDIEQEETQEELAEEYEQFKNAESPDIGKWEDHDAHMVSHKTQRAELLAVIGLPPEATYEQAEATVEQLLQSNPEAQEQFTMGLLALKMLDNHLEEHEEMKKLNPTGQEPKFEDGWRVIKWVENVVMYDGENPEENGMLPIVPFYCYKDETIYGFGEIKNIIDAQRTLNDMDFRELEGLRLVSNPGWIGDNEAEVDAEKLTNEPGIVVLKKRGTELRRLEPGQVSPQLDARKNADQLFMEQASGQNEVTMNGSIPSGNASGVAVQKIQTQAVGRIRLKNRMLEYYSMKRLAELTASLIINNWTEEKVLRFRSDSTKIEEVVYNPLEIENLSYIIEMSPGSMAGVDKDAVNAFYLMLLNGGHITIQEFLKVAEIPKKDMIVESVNQRDQAAAQLQQIQQEAQAMQAQYEQQLAALQEQNIKLKGAMDLGRSASVDLLNGDERKIFERQAKEASINSLITPDDLMSVPQAQEGAIPANPESQGI